MSDRPELPDLLIELNDLSWSDVKQMAVHLHRSVDLKLLTDIEGAHPVSERIMQAMKAWLDRDCEASWAKVVSALRAISKNVLAKEVETNYVSPLSAHPEPERDGGPPQSSTSTEMEPVAHSLEPQPRVGLASVGESQPETPTFSPTTPSSRISLVPAFDPNTIGSSNSNFNGVKIREGAAQLQTQFVTVLTHTKICFMKKEAESVGFLNEFRITLTTLPLSKRHQHMHFLKQEEDRIKKAKDIDEIFDILEPYWNYVDYALLQHIIKEFGTSELKKEMKKYITELEQFEKKTAVQDYDSATPHGRNVHVPAYFETVEVVQVKDPAKCSLYEIRQFQNDIVNQSALKEYSVFRKRVSCSSVNIILAFPPEAHADLVEVFDVRFMTTHKIESKVFCKSGPTKRSFVEDYMCDYERSLDKDAAFKLLKDHMVMISRNLNSIALKAYLIQNGCVTMEESKQFHDGSSRSESNLKLIGMISQRGVRGFNGFMKSLEQFTTHEPGEGAHKELLDKLKVEASNMPPTHRSRPSGQSVQAACRNVSARDIAVIERDLPQPTSRTEPTGQDVTTQFVHKHSVTEQTPEDDDHNINEEIDIPIMPEEEHRSHHIPRFIWLLRLTAVAMIVFSPLLLVGGIALLAFSGEEFAGNIDCAVGIAHALSVFNFFFGLLCLSVPGLLIALILYFRCEDRNTRWEEKFRITRCLVWMTISFFLTFFVLTILELFYSLLYVVPEVINNYSDWKENKTLCDSKVYVSSFSIITIFYSIVFLLLVVLGVYLANLYFKWVTDQDNPGTLRRLINACLQRGVVTTNRAV